jgi:hypothetical protein
MNCESDPDESALNFEGPRAVCFSLRVAVEAHECAVADSSWQPGGLRR